ncbi:MAG: metallophosphoesterase family protein [Actinomycetota bacterium]|nr:metallophosphoesterase family protein [Actinomycetota bacterium]
MSRIGLLGDIHANLPALHAVLEHAGECDSWWCVGDVVGYGPFPNECVRAIKKLRAVCVCGNHDLGAVGGMELTNFNVDARIACEWTGEALEDDSKDFLKALPERYAAKTGELIVHGSPRNPVWEYILSTQVAALNFSAFEENICFHGHSHVPAIFSTGKVSEAAVELNSVKDGFGITLEGEKRYLVNVGSVGQPRDGDPRACYAIYDSEGKTLTFHRVEYPINEVQEKMREEEFPSFLIERLALGQ